MWTSKLKVKIETPSLQRYLFIAIVVCIGVSIYILNDLFPIYSDDWNLSFVEANWETEPTHTHKIGSFKDIFESQYSHYFTWGGRTVVHVIAQFLLWIGPFYHDILNTLAYVALLYVIYSICNVGGKRNIFVFILVSTLLWFFIPRFTSDVLWITGSANYLWGSLIVLVFLLRFIRQLFSGEEINRDSYFNSFFIFIFGVIAGWSNEGMSSVALGITFLICIYLKINRALPKWAIAGFIGVCLGFTIMMLAPGNVIRANLIMTQNPELYTQPFWSIIQFKLIDMMSYKYSHYMLPPTLLFFFSLVIYLKWGMRSDKKRKQLVLLTSSLFFFMGQLSFFVMVFSPTFPLWAMFGNIVLLTISIGLLYANVNFRNNILYLLNFCFIVFVVILYSVDYSRKYPSIKLISDVYKEREAILLEQKSLGVKEIVFTKRIVVHSKFDLIEMGGEDFWFNRRYAFYYGVESVKLVP